MKGFNPLKPDGSDAEFRFHQSTWEKTHGPASKFNDSATVKFNQTTKGISAHAAPQRVGGSPIKAFKFQEMGGDWIRCFSWDGLTAGTTDIYIAKPSLLRFSVASKTINGTLVTYSAYSTATQSRHSSGTDEEDEQITEPYGIGDVIYAIRAPTFAVDPINSLPISLLDLNVDARAWAKV